MPVSTLYFSSPRPVSSLPWPTGPEAAPLTLGTLGSALMQNIQPGRKVYAVQVETQGLLRVVDRFTQETWKQLLHRHRAAGTPGLIYLSRRDAMDIETVVRASACGVDLRAIKDDDFRRFCPGAADRVTVLDPRIAKNFREVTPDEWRPRIVEDARSQLEMA